MLLEIFDMDLDVPLSPDASVLVTGHSMWLILSKSSESDRCPESSSAGAINRSLSGW